MKYAKFWKRLYRILPKKSTYIEGGFADRSDEEEAKILEGEAASVRVYFDESCEYEIVEREITPAKKKCPGCRRTVLCGMEYCIFCGQKLTETT